MSHSQEISASVAWMARPGGGVVLGHGPFKNATAPPDGHTAFFVQDFALSDPAPWKIPARWEELDPDGLRRRFGAVPAPPLTWRTPDTAPFSAVFQEVMGSIQAGHFEKSVPVVVEEGLCPQAPGPAVMAAMSRQTEPFLSYAWSGSGAGFAGATPETLVGVENRTLRTMALASTARRDDRDVFAVDEKEIREHEYVAQTLVAKLNDLGRLRRQPRSILDLGSIVHFQTLIEVALDQPACPASLVRRLHPTPALGSHPHTPETLAQLKNSLKVC